MNRPAPKQSKHAQARARLRRKAAEQRIGRDPHLVERSPEREGRSGTVSKTFSPVHRIASYVGSFPVQEGHDTQDHITTSLRQLVIKQSALGKPVKVMVLSTGVKVFRADGEKLFMAHALPRITSVMPMPERQIFAFVALNPPSQGGEKYCHCFYCSKVEYVNDLCGFVSKAFKLAYAARIANEQRMQPDRAPAPLPPAEEPVKTARSQVSTNDHQAKKPPPKPTRNFPDQRAPGPQAPAPAEETPAHQALMKDQHHAIAEQFQSLLRLKQEEVDHGAAQTPPVEPRNPPPPEPIAKPFAPPEPRNPPPEPRHSPPTDRTKPVSSKPAPPDRQLPTGESVPPSGRNLPQRSASSRRAKVTPPPRNIDELTDKQQFATLPAAAASRAALAHLSSAPQGKLKTRAVRSSRRDKPPSGGPALPPRSMDKPESIPSMETQSKVESHNQLPIDTQPKPKPRSRASVRVKQQQPPTASSSATPEDDAFMYDDVEFSADMPPVPVAKPLELQKNSNSRFNEDDLEKYYDDVDLQETPDNLEQYEVMMRSHPVPSADSTNHDRRLSGSDDDYEPMVPTDEFEEDEERDNFHEARWFQASVPREVAVEMLSQQAEGAFMVRESSSYEGCFALSLRTPGKQRITSFLIKRTEDGKKLYLDEKLKFDDLTSLIEYHEQHKSILPCTLSNVSSNPRGQNSEKDVAKIVNEDDDYERFDFTNLKPLPAQQPW